MSTAFFSTQKLFSPVEEINFKSIKYLEVTLAKALANPDPTSVKSAISTVSHPKSKNCLFEIFSSKAAAKTCSAWLVDSKSSKY